MDKYNICEEILANNLTTEAAINLLNEKNIFLIPFFNSMTSYCRNNNISDADYRKLRSIYELLKSTPHEQKTKKDTKWYNNIVKVLNYNYTDVNDLSKYIENDVAITISTFYQCVNSYKKYFRYNEKEITQLDTIVDLLQSNKNDRRNYKRQATYQNKLISVYPVAEDFANQFIESYDYLKLFINKIHLDHDTAELYFESVKALNKPLYSEFKNNILLKNNIYKDLVKEKIDLLLYLLKHKKVEPLDYYTYIKLDKREAINYAQKNLNEKDARHIINYFRKTHDAPLSEETVLNETMIIGFNGETEGIENNGIVVPSEYKIQTIEYLKANQLPLIESLYYDVLNRILHNKINLNIKIPSLYNEYLTKIANTDYYKSKQKVYK